MSKTKQDTREITVTVQNGRVRLTGPAWLLTKPTPDEFRATLDNMIRTKHVNRNIVQRDNRYIETVFQLAFLEHSGMGEKLKDFGTRYNVRVDDLSMWPKEVELSALTPEQRATVEMAQRTVEDLNRHLQALVALGVDFHQHTRSVSLNGKPSTEQYTLCIHNPS